jgi:hypothetical protein
LKYVEPAEAREPTKKWRLYVFKGDKQIGNYIALMFLKWRYAHIC